MDLAKFRARLEQARAAKQLSQAELGRRAGVPPSTISSWLSQDDPPTPTVDALDAICRTLDVSIDWIVGRTEDPKVIPFGEILIDAEVVARIMGAKYLDDVADLLDTKQPVSIGFDVEPATEMPPRAEAERILQKARARMVTLRWKKR